MSILQEYESIRKQIGESRYEKIQRFLENHKEYLLSDVYYKSEVWEQMMLEYPADFLDVKIGDVINVVDEYSREGYIHILKIFSIEFDKENATETNPKGMVCYGNDLSRDKDDEDYITVCTESVFLSFKE